MITRVTQAVRVTDSSAAASARRVGAQFAETLGLGEVAAGRVALTVTELATNLLKHAQGGAILFGSDDARPKAVSILSLDKGRGIPNVQAAMQDGYSTAGSTGTGLGALRRSSISFEVYTLPAKGTIIHCLVGDEGASPSPLFPKPRFAVAGIGVPKTGETANGDSWGAFTAGDTATIGVADGLGHGPLAETASTAAVRVFQDRAGASIEHMMQDAHAALRPTRGAAAAVARVHGGSGRVDFIGVGNIAGTIVRGDDARRTVSLPGIVGHEMRKLQPFSYAWGADSVLVLHSDGLSAHWTASVYPGLLQQSPALIAGALYRDHCRGTDDATVVVVKAS